MSETLTPDAIDAYCDVALRNWLRLMYEQGVDPSSIVALETMIAGSLITGIQFAGRHPEYAMALVQGHPSSAAESMDALVKAYPIAPDCETP